MPAVFASGLKGNPFNPNSRARSRVNPSADAEPPNPLLARQSDFKISEGYELRAIKLFDRLPETNYSRIEAHRRLAKWYRFFNQTKEENFQIQVLSKLLHTTDPTILFPKFDPCYGCGRG